jgi:hypothetical protein
MHHSPQQHLPIFNELPQRLSLGGILVDQSAKNAAFGVDHHGIYTGIRACHPVSRKRLSRQDDPIEVFGVGFQHPLYRGADGGRGQ